MTKQSFITLIVSGYFIVARFPISAVKLDLVIKWALLLNLVISIYYWIGPYPLKTRPIVKYENYSKPYCV